MATAARDFRVVLVMAGNEEEARNIARSLVEERLAACVNIVASVHSIYRWRSRIEEANEYMLLIKTGARQLPKLERRVAELHSYEVPEIIAMRLEAGSRPYLEWLAASTTQAGRLSPRPRKRRARA